MDNIVTNWILFVALFVMLLGAYLLGYFFGNKKKKPFKKFESKQVKEKHVKSIKSSKENYNNDTLIIEDYQPGKIRAKKTRERTGLLTEEISVVEKAITESNKTVINESLEKDDLTKIQGINIEIARKLNDYGILFYSQISELGSNDIRKLSKEIDIFPGRIHRDDWKGQAKNLMNPVNSN